MRNTAVATSLDPTCSLQSFTASWDGPINMSRWMHVRTVGTPLAASSETWNMVRYILAELSLSA